MAKAYIVSLLQVYPVESKPAALVIFVAGAVTSRGWTQIHLSPWLYTAPPADGIYDFDLTGVPSAGAVLNAITPVAAAVALSRPPKDLKGVRVHASANRPEALLSEAVPIDFPEAGISWSGDLPWPELLRMEESGGSGGI